MSRFLLTLIFIALWGLPLHAQSSGPRTPITLSFIGDIMAHAPNFNMRDYNRIYYNVREYLENDDLTFANLEAPIDDDMEYRTYPRFNVQSPYVEAAIRSSVEVFSLANNHVNDWGISSLEGTLRALRELQRDAAGAEGVIHFSGIRATANQSLSVETIIHKRWKIGFMAVTQFVNNADQTANYVQLINYNSAADVERLLTEIERVIDDYDIFIVSYHGGLEYRIEAEEKKRELFQSLAERGVDVVWGHHPHVLQPWEVYRNARGEEALLMYSLGNFISSQTWSVPPDDPLHRRAPTGDSIIARARFTKRGGALKLLALEEIPISHYKTPEREVEVRPYRDLLRGINITPEWREYYRARYQILQETYNIGARE